MRYSATVNGEPQLPFDAKNDRLAVDAARSALPAEGTFNVTVTCLDEVMLASGEMRPACEVSSFTVLHEVAQ